MMAGPADYFAVGVACGATATLVVALVVHFLRGLRGKD